MREEDQLTNSQAIGAPKPKQRTKRRKRKAMGWSVKTQLRLLALAVLFMLAGLLVTITVGLQQSTESSRKLENEYLQGNHSLSQAQEAITRLHVYILNLHTQLLAEQATSSKMQRDGLSQLIAKQKGHIETLLEGYTENNAGDKEQAALQNTLEALNRYHAGAALYLTTLHNYPNSKDSTNLEILMNRLNIQGSSALFSKMEEEAPIRRVLQPTYQDISEKLSNLKRQRISSARMLAEENNPEYVLWLSVILALLVVVAVLLTIPLINQRIAGSVRRINRVIRSLAHGDLNKRRVPVRNDEFRDLSRGVNSLSHSLHRIAQFAEQIGEGKFDAEFEKHGDADQLGSALNQMRERLQTVAEEDRKRNWTVAGLAKFSEIFRLSQDVNSLAERVILSLSKYIRANQGAFFILENHDADAEKHHLKMISSYAYTKGTGVQREFKLGEGFVGQAAVEKEVIYISDIPVDYVTLTSGLGEAQPRCLLIAPLMYNEEVHGVVEFASFTSFEAHEIEFVKKLSESIGVALGNLKNQERTLYLLQESQNLGTELQQKQQALLENTQVLEANQAQMTQTQHELEGQINAVNNAAIVSETDPQGNILFINHRFTQVSGYAKSELVGQNHRILKSGLLKDEDWRELWGTLEAGRVWHGEFKNKSKDGGFYWVEATITPVLGPDGKPQKFISIQFDITQQKTQEEQIRTQLEVSMAQEEELRQNAEEMEAQQEEMRRTQIELTGMINALNNSAIVSSADPQGRIISVNDQFLQVSAYSREELIGQNHRILKSGHQADDIYEQLWQTITKGDVWKGELKNKGKDNSYYWVTATITPVLDAQRKPVKYIAVTFDVTSQKLQEEQIRAALEISQAQEAELRQNAEELQSAQDEMRKTQIELRGQIGAVNNAGIVAETDLRGLITLVNEEFCRVSGYAREELLGQNHRILRSGEHPVAFYEELWESITSGDVWSGIFHNKTKDAADYWVKTTVTPVLGFDGKPVKYIAVSFDITAQITQQQQLAENTEVMEAQAIELEGQISALNNAALVTETDKDGIITLVNEEVCRIWGYERDELLGKPHNIVRSDEHEPAFFEEMWQTIAGGAVWTGEVKNQTKTGETFWVQLSITPVKDNQNQVLKYIGVGFDITKNKRQASRIKMLFQQSKEQEKQLRETQIELNGQLSALNNAAIVSETDTEGVITLVNDEATFIWGYSREEVIGQKHSILKSAEHTEKFYKRMWDKITQGQIWQGQILNKSKNGEHFWVQLSITPVLNEQGVPVKYIGVGFDITSQKEQSQRIKQALDEAAVLENQYAKEIEELKTQLTQTGDTPTPQAEPTNLSGNLSAALPMACLRLDVQLNVLHSNPPAQELLGDIAVGTPLAQLCINKEQLPDQHALLYDIARNGRASTLLYLKGEHGKVASFCAFVPVADEGGTLQELLLWLLPADSISLTRFEQLDTQAPDEVGEALAAALGLQEEQDATTEAPASSKTKKEEKPRKTEESTDKSAAAAETTDTPTEVTKEEAPQKRQETTPSANGENGHATPAKEEAKPDSPRPEAELEKAAIFSSDNPYSLAEEQAMVIHTDLLGDITGVNEQLLSMYGITEQDALGKNPRIFRSEASDPGRFFDIWATISRGKVWRGELVNRKPDGTDHWVYLQVGAVYDDEGRGQGYCAFINDIHDQQDKIPNPSQVLSKKYRPMSNE